MMVGFMFATMLVMSCNSEIEDEGNEHCISVGGNYDDDYVCNVDGKGVRMTIVPIGPTVTTVAMLVTMLGLLVLCFKKSVWRRR